MLHSFLQNQLAAFTHLHGELSPANIAHLLEMVSEAYYNYEQRYAERQAAGKPDVTPHVAHVMNTIQTLKEVIFSVDMVKYELLFIAKSCEAVYGYTVEEFHLNPNLWYDVVFDEDKRVIDANRPLMMQGGSIVHEYRIRRKDGSVRWLESRMEPTLDENGRLIRLDGVTIDLTEYKKAQIALENSEKKFRSLIENASDAITIADEHLNFTFTSQAVSRMTGYAPEEIVGRPIFDFFHPDEIPQIQQNAANIVANPGVPYPVIVRLRKKDGGWIWVEGLSTNMLHEPAVNGIVTNFRDVTDRHNYEENLRQSNERLKKANEELDRFVYSVSHDLRAPLASVLGAIEYSRTETTDPDMVENLEMMKSSIMKLDVFILDILDFSRNSRMAMKTQGVDFNELLHDVSTNLKFMTSGNKDVEIRYNIEGNHEFVSDKSRISIVLNNLISNGIRYYNPKAEKPYVEVNVKVGEDKAQIAVKDNGLGIDKKYHDRIFDMFFRASNKSNGSGLGLYILKETLDKLNGSLELDSEPGIGSEFRISLPNLAGVHNN